MLRVAEHIITALTTVVSWFCCFLNKIKFNIEFISMKNDTFVLVLSFLSYK